MDDRNGDFTHHFFLHGKNIWVVSSSRWVLLGLFVSKGLEICQKHEPKNGFFIVLDDVLLFPNAFVKGDVVFSTSCRGFETTEKKHFKHFPYILPWEPKTFIFRGDNPYFWV